ncbi:MAG: DNA translocase FtsK, partial [Oscillospiraceae bacterium]|nr:DNA translocase FtsK [Oscillospiraceae bacterium]
KLHREANVMAAKKKTNTRTKRKTKQKKNYYTTYVIADLLITILLAVFMYIDSGETGGYINDLVKQAFCGLWGPVGYFMPVVTGGLLFYLVKYRDTNRFWNKLILLLLAMVNVSAIINLSADTGIGDAYYWGAEYCMGGGFLGACVSVFMEKMVQTVASYIILSFTLILLASAIANVSIIGMAAKYIRVMFLDVKDKCGDLRESYNERRSEEYEEYEEYEDSAPEENDAVSAANSFAFDNQPDKTKKTKKKKAEKKSEKKTEEEKEPAKEIEQSSGSDFSDGIDEVFGKLDSGKEVKVKEEAVEATEITESADKPETDTPKKKTSKITDEERDEFHQELNAAIEKPPVEYVYPSLNLLNKPKAMSGDQREEMRRNAEKLIAILDDFGVKAKLLQVTQGPTVTRYEIQPDTGIKLSKIVGLADDIALNLAVSTVLIAPVPGKAAVGVEIPNKKVASVSIREILDTTEFKKSKSKLTIALGKDIGGNVVLGDIAKMPHVLIAGATGSGKSVCINSIIMSILYKASPEEVKLIMVDPKVVELGVYNGIPHLLIPVVTEPKKAAGALNWAVAEMMRRYELFKETSVRKLESYNKLMESTGGEKIPQIVIIIDELADLMMVAAKEVEDYIVRLTQLARAAGLHLIIATQRPSVDVITGLIKANVPSRIAFAVSSQVDSRTIIDKGGAEKLLGNGDMLYYPMGARATTRVQGAFVSDPEIEKVLDFIKENMGETHYSEDLAEHIERCSTGENGVTPDVEEDGDPLLQDAIQLAVECGKISTSLIQRRLSVGYSRAGRIIDQMEARGIISGANGLKPRDVLISHADMNMIEDDSDEE